MPAVCILTPTIIAAWPAISAAVAGAAAALGLTVVREGALAVASAEASVRAAQAVGTQAVEVEVENCEVIGAAVATEQEIVLARGDVLVRVRRDARGACKVCVEGKAHSKAELRELGERVVEKLTQVYVYNQVMTELKSKGFSVVSEHVADDESVHIRVRQHVV